MTGEGDASDQDIFCQPRTDPDDEDNVDLGQALVNDPIVGVDHVLLDEHGPGALQPKPLASPLAMLPHNGQCTS